MRTLTDIDADITATAKRLVELETERKQTDAARKAAILADFDAGMSRKDLCAKHDILLSSLGTLLWNNNRSTKTQALAGLTPAEQVIFRKAQASGVKGAVARRIAQAIGSGAPA